MLIDNFTYVISDNCVLRYGAHGSPLTKLGKEIEETLSMNVDNRLWLVSYQSTNDLVEYFQYFFLLSMSAKRKLASEDFMKGQFVAMLDNGFVPFYMAPTYMKKEIGDTFKDIIKSTGITFIEKKPMRFDGTRIDAESNDIWISRPEAARYSRCQLADFNTLEFVKGVWRNAHN